MKTLKVKQRTVAYSIKGEGQPLILLHGFCEDHHIWGSFQEQLSANYMVVAIDLPGFGRSEVWPDISIKAMAEAVLGIIKELKLNRSVVIGHSMGGYVALSLAQIAAEFLGGIGLFHSHVFADNSDKIKSRMKAIDFIRRHGHSPFVGQLFPTLFAPGTHLNYSKLISQLVDLTEDFSQEGIIEATRAMASRPDQQELLRQLNLPILFIVGKHDRTISLKQSLRQAAIPNKALIHILNSSGHMGMYEEQEESLQAIQKFVNVLV